MKGQETIKQKATPNVRIKILTIILVLYFNNIFCQIVPPANTEPYNIQEDYHIISDKQYEVINAVFPEKKPHKKSLIYHRVYFDKTWAAYFYGEGIERLTGLQGGLPIKVTDTELSNILTKSKRNKIANEISNAQPLMLEQSKLVGITLVKEFDTGKAIKDGVGRVSKPIIVDDVAVLKILWYDVYTIYILKKIEGEWDIIFTVHDWYSIE